MFPPTEPPRPIASEPAWPYPRRVSRKRGSFERLFISLDPPEEVRRAVSAWGRDAAGALGSGRPIGTGSIHLTLAFLGSRPTAESDAISAAIGGIDRAPLLLSTAGPVFLPRRRPKALAVGIGDHGAGLASLRDDLVDRLDDAIGWIPERPGFLPHLTAVRFGRNDTPGRAIELPPTPSIEFEATDIVLYRSTLETSGAVYDELFRRRLSEAGREP